MSDNKKVYREKNDSMPKLKNGSKKKANSSGTKQIKGTDYNKRLMTKNVVRVKNKFSYKDLAVKICSISLSLILIVIMILNMPIIAYNKNVNGQVINENVSIITYLKRWQPLVDTEGELSAVDITDIKKKQRKTMISLICRRLLRDSILFCFWDLMKAVK